MASIDRVMALAEELKKKKKDPNYQINQSTINVTDLATDMKSGNKDALKNYIESDRGMFDAPIRTTVTNKSNAKDPDKKWYQQVFTKGEFKDGYDFGDVSKTILGTGMDLTEGLMKGILSPVESVVDIGTNLVASGIDAFGNEKKAEKWRDFADKDLTSNFASKASNATPIGIAYNILNGEPEKIFNPAGIEWDKDKSIFENAKQGFNQAYLTESNEAYEDSSVMGYYADKTTELVGYALSLIYGGQALTGATGTKAVGLTNTAGKTMVGASASGGNIGLTLNGMTLNVPTLAFTGGMASGLQEANSKENVTETERWTKAFSSGAIEGATEGLFGMFGVGGVTNQAGQEIFDVAGSKVASLFKTSVGKTLANAGIKATGEMAEEFIAYTLNYLTDNHIIDKMGEADFSNEWNWKELGETLALSFASSMIMQGGGGLIQTNTAISQAEKQLGRKLTNQEKALVTQASIEGTLEQKVQYIEQGRNYDTGLTQNEQSIVDKEVESRKAELEQDGTKLTKKQITEIEKQVRNDLEKGYISTDTIESTLGGETYNTLKSTRDTKTNLENQIAELESKPNAEITVKEMEQLQSLREQLKSVDTNTLENNLRSEMGQKIKSDAYLQRSYQEKANRSVKFEADLSKYDAKQQAVVQKAIDSGVLNNTNRTHDFVDMVAKISADKGIDFDFTNNTKLKESGFAVEGKTVNGYIKDGSIAVNIDSSKALNRVVGHEITHVLEGTELYTELQNAVKQYATTKGEYNSRLADLTKLYKNVKDANIENELTADLVGDYLFTDTDFINNLSVEKPSLFKKVYNEIKHLYDMATAGSKEARELLKVKKAFEKAYQENIKGTKETSVSEVATETTSQVDSLGRELSTEQTNFFKDSKVVDEDGNLLVMYHGTRADFNTFDMNKSGQNYEGDWSAFGRGFYFTPNQEAANEFSSAAIEGNSKNVKEVYLNITKPFYTEDSYSESNLKGKYNLDDATLDKGYKVIEYLNKNGYDSTKVLQELGYDGVIDSYNGKIEEVVAFKPNQIKNTDNTKPTLSEDIRYSLSSETDNKGRTLTNAQVERFKDSKVRDNEGKLKEIYHGTTADFNKFSYEFLGTNGTNYGVGFYLTDKIDTAKGYADRGENGRVMKLYADITNPLSYGGSTISPEQFKKFVEAINEKSNGQLFEDMSGEQVEKGSAEYEAVLDDIMMDFEYGGDDIDVVENILSNEVVSREEGYRILKETTGKDGIIVETSNGDNALGNVYIPFLSSQIKNVDNLNPTNDPDIRYSLSEEQQTELERKAISEQLKKKGASVDGDGNVTLYHITTPENYNKIMSDKQFIPNQSPIGGGMALGEIGDRSFFTYDKEWVETWRQSEDSIVMEVKVPAEFIRQGAQNEKEIYIEGALKLRDNGLWTTDKKPTSTFYDRLAVKRYLKNNLNMSLSNPNEQIAPSRNDVFGRDIRLEIAPLQEEVKALTETVTELRNVIDMGRNTTEADLPMLEQQSNEAFNTLTDEDYAPTIEDTTPEYEPTTIESPLEADGRDIDSVGNRKVKAYQYENPEVRPYFQAEARVMLGDLHNSIKGERSFNDQVYYDTAGEQGFYGTTRQTTDDIAYLKDSFGYTYGEIEKGLNAIIEDHGAENIAVAKRIEFMLDERLREGYTSIDGTEIPANQEYINLLQGMEQAKQYSEAPLGEAPYVEEASNTNIAEDIAPIRKAFNEGVRESAKQIEKELGYLPKDPTKESSYEEVAEILTEEPKTQNDRNKRKAAIIAANVLDKGLVFENVSLKHKNRELMGKWDYTLTSEARAQTAIGQGHYDNETGRTISKSLNEIMEEVNNTGLTKQFYEYIYHKHNIDRMQLADKFEGMKNKPVFGEHITAEASQEIVNQYEFSNPEFMDFAKDVYEYVNADRKVLVDNGVISQETADLWSKMYPHYVPIRRAGHNGNAINVPLDTGRTGINAPIKKATGGSSDILPLFDTMASRTLQTYRAAAKNSFGVELKNTIGTTINSQATTVDEVIDSVDAQESLLQEGKAGQKPTFTVFENGEKITFEITKDMYDALKPLSDSSILSKTHAIPNRISSIHRGLLTQYNPVFAITNGIKDIQDVLINSQHVVKTYSKIPEAYAQIFKKGYWYQEYMANGGQHNSFFDSQENTFDTGRKGVDKILDLPPLKQIAQLNDFIEIVPRLSEYIASREMGRSIEVSMLDAARVTTNFKAGGNLTKYLNRNGITFLNASVQGAMQQVRNVREAKANGIKGWANLATKFTIAGLPAFLLNAFLWDDDDEYEELSDYVKQNYYVVAKTDDGKFIRIPKGRALAVIQDGFKQMKNLVTGDDEADLKSFLDLVVNNLAPSNPIESNIAAPILDVIENETWYGEDLVPTRLQDLPAAEQYDESTDSFSKWLGGVLDISPVKINYLLDQYSGGVGDVVLPMLTPEAESGDDSFLGNMIAPLKSKFTTDAVMNNQNVSDFYSLSEELTTNAKKKNATDEDVLKNKYVNSVKAEMNELYAEKREIQNSDLPSSEKYNQVREIQSKIVDLSKKALNSYEDIDIYSDYATVGDRQYKVGSDGEWEKINDKQLEKQNAVTNSLGITPNEYWNNKEEYDYAYENPSKYAVATAITDYSTFKTYSSELYDIKADKDANGKTISGSRKEKVFDYINNLDLGFEQRVMLAKLEYPSYDEYNYDIIEYLNNRDDIDYEKMVLILTELGFTVDSEGNIFWD